MPVLFVLASLLAIAVEPGSVVIDVQWSAPAACPDRAAFEARLARHLRAASSSTPIRVRGTVTTTDTGYALALGIEVDGQLNPRTLENDSCEALTEAAALVAAIAIAPEATVMEPEPEPEPIPPVVVVPETQPGPPTERTPPIETARVGSTMGAADAVTPPRPRQPRPQLSLRAAAGVGYGPLPVGADLTLAFATFGTRWRAEVWGTYMPPRRVFFADVPDSGAALSTWAIGVGGCGTLPVRRWLQIPLCAGVEAGQLIAVPTGLRAGRTRTPTWAAATAGPALRFVPHRRVALWLSPAVVVPFVRTAILVAGDPRPLYEPTAAGLRALIGLEIVFSFRGSGPLPPPRRQSRRGASPFPSLRDLG